MTQPKRELTEAQLLRDLEGLSVHFNTNATLDQRTADALKEAAQALREAQKKNQELQRRLDAIETDKKSGQSAPLLTEAKAEKPAVDRLIGAIHWNNLKEVKLLLDKGVNVNESAATTKSIPLMYAVRSGSARAVRLLIDHGADTEAKDAFGKTALEIAKSYYGYAQREIVQLLEEAAAAKAKKPAEGLLSNAVIWDNPEEVKGLLDRGANVDERGLHETTPLMYVASYGRTDLVRLLIDYGANIEAKNASGLTALDIAKRRQRPEVVRLLEEAAAAKAAEKPAAGLLSLSMHTLDEIKLLIDKGANVNEREAYTKFTPLISAACNGHTDLVRLLIDRGADIEAKNAYGESALDIARRNKRSETVQLLEEAAAKPKLVVLIDGSGSMAWQAPDTQSRLQTSLDAVLDLSNAGTKVSALLWGHKDLVPVEATKEAFETVAKGLNCGTEFMPVVDYMKKTAAGKPQNFVIISDGDLYGYKDESLKTRAFLYSNPKTTLDFMVINKKEFCPMETFAQALKDEFPNQVRFASTRDGAGVKTLLQNITLRTRHSDKPGYQAIKALRPCGGLL